MSEKIALPAHDELLKRFKKVIALPLEGFCDEASITSRGKTYDAEQFAGMLIRSQINYCQGKPGQFFGFLTKNMDGIIDVFVDDPAFAEQAKAHYLRMVSSP